MKLLVVESNINIQRLYREELEEEGYDIIIASTGREALDKFQTEEPDAVTMEILLPDIAGAALLRALKEQRPYIPILMSTAFDYTDDFSTLLFDTYVLKSSDLSELKENIKKFEMARLDKRTGISCVA